MNFTFIRLVALSVLLAPLGACKNVDPATLQEAAIPQFKSVATDQNSALIKSGSVESDDGFGVIKGAAYPISVDGQRINPQDYARYSISIEVQSAVPVDPARNSVRITPGTHSILVGYKSLNRYVDGVAAVVLDAKPGITYVVMGQDRYKPDLLNPMDITHNYLYIVEERTSKVVTDEVTDVPRRNTNTYSEPSGTGLATIRGNTINGSDIKNCYPMAIDGKYTKWLSGTLADRPDYQRDFKVTPGRHALGIGIAYGLNTTAGENVFDFQPNTTYQIGCETSKKRYDSDSVNVFTVWIENAATKEIVLPKSDLPFRNLPK
ncbi:MAG: hypothetical protein Q7T44_01130 [Parvibaculum sp.]|nr:hypothetical protein [Parvibaculum sp.]